MKLTEKKMRKQTGYRDKLIWKCVAYFQANFLDCMIKNKKNSHGLTNDRCREPVSRLLC